MANEYIKSPLNYTGGKYRLLPQILPLFPKKINQFVDLFCGGGNVGINIDANKIICNDIQCQVIDFLHNCKEIESGEMIKILQNTINKYQLSKTNENGFKQIRQDYNNGLNSWNMFYAMVTNAFNYQIRFNSKGEYNMPFGKDRSSFNPTLEENFIKFINACKTKNICFINSDFRELKINKLNSDDLVYCDPPYLLTCASYNEQNGWNINLERDLLCVLNDLDLHNIKFALSNVIEHKGKSNDVLKKWAERYNVHYLDYNYSNCNYHTKDRDTNASVEVLITNY